MKRVRYVQQTARDDRTKLDRVVHELGDSRRDLTRRLPRVPATSRILSGTFGEHPPRASGRASSRCAFSRGRNISLERRRLASPPLILHFFRVFTETRSRDHLFPSQFNSTIRCILMIEKREREREREEETHRKAEVRRRISVRPEGEPAFHFLSRRFCACSNLQQNDGPSMRP